MDISVALWMHIMCTVYNIFIVYSEALLQLCSCRACEVNFPTDECLAYIVIVSSIVGCTHNLFCRESECDCRFHLVGGGEA